MRKVLLVGPFPPPYGGLAVQLCQWQRYLAATETYTCKVLNIGESRTMDLEGCISVTGNLAFLRQVFQYARNGYLIHLLTNGHNFKSWLSCVVCASAGLVNNRQTLIVLGSGNTARYLTQVGPMANMVMWLTLKLAGHVICRNEETRIALLQCGASGDRVSIVPGFLGVDASPALSIPDMVRDFVDSHEPVFGATASVDPEYGIPLMFALLERLHSTYPRLGLILMGPNLDAVRSRYGPLPGNVLATGPLPHASVIGTMQRLHVFLRPTHFDGDSISVREALALDIPVVASQVGFRPPGVTLFPAGDLEAFVAAVGNVLLDDTDNTHASEPRESSTPERLTKIYNQLFQSCEGTHATTRA